MPRNRYFLPHVFLWLSNSRFNCLQPDLSTDDYWHRWEQCIHEVLAVTANLPLVPQMSFFLSILFLRFRKTSLISEHIVAVWLVSFQFGSAISRTSLLENENGRDKNCSFSCFVILEGEDYFENSFVGKECLCTPVIRSSLILNSGMGIFRRLLSS